MNRKTIGACLLVSLMAMAAFAQSSTTATIRGKVSNEQGTAVGNAEINAVNLASGFVKSVRSGSDGAYVLSGLAPGDYNLVVAAPGFEPRSENLTVRVGQVLDMNLRLTPGAVLSESITVIGNQLIETRTSEAATNVTPQQIEALPQNDRNFLNFAALAPGIRLSRDPQRKTFSGDAQDAERTNVFIDGVSFKNDVLQGGVVGQDASGGNPFPQNAVQEFRVITQNYSAQYDKASSAIITAVTKSGGNDMMGDAFVFYQPEAWVEPLEKNFQFSTLATNESYHRYQSGVSAGGPIIKDKLHWFLSYEGDQEHGTRAVNLGNTSAANVARFGQYAGTFSSPFRSNLLFGKASLQPNPSQTLDWSINYRKEYDIRDFGGGTAREAATKQNNWVYGSTLRHQWTGNNTLNQATLSLQKYSWNPTPLNPDLVGLDYQGVIRIGGKDTLQKFDQRRIELRDDYNFATFKWQGDHNVQVGGNVDFMRYHINKSLAGNPIFRFRNDPAQGYSFDSPFEASYGFGNPILNTTNREYGIYGQDNWMVNPRLTLNIGLRWDYESSMIDTDYVTPAAIVNGLKGVVSSDYFSTGSEREQFKSAFQPRVGFSYDLRGDSRSVVFGGFGRYYDRIFMNSTLDERYRQQFPVYNIQFCPPSNPTCGKVPWNDQNLTKAGLDAIIAQGSVRPEIFLINNNLKPPYSNQWNLGYRQSFGSWLGSASYNVVRGYRGITFLSASGICCTAPVPGFGNVIINDPEGKRFWYDGLHVSVDRPYTSQAKWGARFVWTHATSEQTGNDLFSLDLPSAAAYGRHAVPGSEKDRIVATGIFGLPFAVRFSTIVTLGSGAATNVLDFSKGFSLADREQTHPFKRSIYPEKTWGFADRSVDFRLEKEFPTFGSTSIGVIAEVFNAGNWANYGCLQNFIGPPPNADQLANLGQPGCVINLGRREQLGLRVRF